MAQILVSAWFQVSGPRTFGRLLRLERTREKKERYSTREERTIRRKPLAKEERI